MLSAAIFIPVVASLVFAFLPRRGAFGPAGERRLQVIATVIAAVPLLLIAVAWLRFA